MLLAGPTREDMLEPLGRLFAENDPATHRKRFTVRKPKYVASKIPRNQRHGTVKDWIRAATRAQNGPEPIRDARAEPNIIQKKQQSQMKHTLNMSWPLITGRWPV